MVTYITMGLIAWIVVMVEAIRQDAIDGVKPSRESAAFALYSLLLCLALWPIGAAAFIGYWIARAAIALAIYALAAVNRILDWINNK